MSSGLSFQWPWNPWAVIFLLLLCLLYILGLRSVRRRGIQISTLHITSFGCGILLAALLLLTPIETIGRTQLFFIHMTQTVLLITVCTPMIMAGCTEELLRPLVEIPLVRNVVLTLIRPVVASFLFNIDFLLWHTPRLFALAQAHEMVYHLMMISIFFFSFLNWHPLIGSVQEGRHMSYPAQMMYTFFDGQPVDIFAFVLVFTEVPIYSFAIPASLHLSAFADQATGGAILLIPGLVDLGVMTPLFFRWLRQIEDKTRQTDAKRQAEVEDEEWEWVEDDDGVEGTIDRA
ncbi:MAG TPA: cytochrome c oxidase assembly protein [Ktedonobacteraceae bacterium]